MNALVELRKLVAPPDLAIDLGTAYTRLFTQRHGLLVEEPTMVHQADGAITAVGLNAARRQNLDPSLETASPVCGGFVRDAHAVGTLLRTLLHQSAPGAWSLGSRFIRALVCLPSQATHEERANILAAVRAAGIASATPVSQALAAAIGAGLDVASPYAQLVVDIGAGTTEIAIVRSGAIVQAQTLRIASGAMHRAVQQNISNLHRLRLSLREAELLTRAVGFTGYLTEERTFLSRGYEFGSGQPLNFYVSSFDVAEALLPAGQQLLQAIHQFIQNLEPELACEVIESGLMLAGGGALLPGLSERLAQLTGLAVKVAPEPLRATVLGAGQMLQVSAATGLWAKAS